MNEKSRRKLLQIIRDLDALPADHEPEASDLWDALRQIQQILEEKQEHRQ